MSTSQKRQRHGVENHRGIDAMPAFYAGAAQSAVPILPIKAAGKRVPPFGRDVERAVGEGKNPNVTLFATPDAWVRACNRTRGTAIMLPPGESPESIQWPRVPAGVFVNAAGQPRELAFRIARAVVSCGSPLAFAVYGNAEALIVRTTAHAQTLELVP